MTARSPERLFHLVFEPHDGRALGAESEEKHEPVSDIDTGVVDSLKALDPDGRLEKRTSFRSFTPPALCECCHCGLARLRIAMSRRSCQHIMIPNNMTKCIEIV